MTDFNTAARQEAERRYPDRAVLFGGETAEDMRVAAFEAGARWGAEQAEATLREIADLADEWAKHAHEWPNMRRASDDLRSVLAGTERRETGGTPLSPTVREAGDKELLSVILERWALKAPDGWSTAVPVRVLRYLAERARRLEEDTSD